LYWYFADFEEMKEHSGEGIGGLVGLLLGIFCVVVNWFLLPAEVGNLYQREGRESPVSGATGLWALLLGWLFGIGLIIWVVKTQGALNDYWESKGQTRS
jgi:hypothetical protein